MTLVIVGHDYKPDQSYWGSTKDVPKMVSNGIFAVADSAITAPGTNGEKTILGGFRKVYSIPFKVYIPYFIEGSFQKYSKTIFESECFIAIAGSTLTAQHVLNSITEHLNQIRISYRRDNIVAGEQRKPVLIRHCEKNELADGLWDEEMFYPERYEGVVNAEAVAKIVDYSINEALKSARKYKLDEESFRGMFTDFALGIYCPLTKAHKLYVYRMSKRLDSKGVLEVFADKIEITEGKIAVLGMREKFESDAHVFAEALLKSGYPTGENMFGFLNRAIDQVKAEKSFEIDRPAFWKHFSEGKLTIKGKARDTSFDDDRDDHD